MAPQHLTAGSWGTASAVPTASEAADAVLKALAELSPHEAPGRTPAQILRAAGRSSLEVEVRRKAPGQPDEIFGRLVAGLPAVGGPIYPDFVTYSYIAHFVEVGVEANKGRADSRVTSSLRVRETGYRISA